MKALGLRLLAAMLGVYLTLGLVRTGLGLLRETRRADGLRLELARTRAQIAALEEAEAVTDQEVRTLALRKLGLISPGDVVFFDGGAWDPEDGGRPEN